VASGSAAITYAILNIAGAGDEIVSASTLTEEHIIFLRQLTEDWNKTVFVDPDDPENSEKPLMKRQRLFILSLLETPELT